MRWKKRRNNVERFSDNGRRKEEGHIPKVFYSYPVRNELVRWEKKEDGTVVLIYRKNLSRFERWLQKHIGGPLDIRRPLDAPGSRIWELCDERHTLLDICRIMDEEFKEEMDPVFDKVRRFIEHLLMLNLLFLKAPEKIVEAPAKESKEEK